jgi:hypothetical protein
VRLHNEATGRDWRLAHTSCPDTACSSSEMAIGCPFHADRDWAESFSFLEKVSSSSLQLQEVVRPVESIFRFFYPISLVV